MDRARLPAGSARPDPDRACRHDPGESDKACPAAQTRRCRRSSRSARLPFRIRAILPLRLRRAAAAAPRLENAHHRSSPRLPPGAAAERPSTSGTSSHERAREKPHGGGNSVPLWYAACKFTLSSHHLNELFAGGSGMNVLKLIKKDHSDVQSLFNKFEKTAKSSHEKREEIFEQIRRGLQIHSRVEEEIFYPFLKSLNGNSCRHLVSEALKVHKEIDELL